MQIHQPKRRDPLWDTPCNRVLMNRSAMVKRNKKGYIKTPKSRAVLKDRRKQ